MASTDWKRFERLVAAIHHAESVGAEVRWDDVIEGRQFDVTIRFKFGLHGYLTVIECKDYTGKVPVEKIDAFVTKSRDVRANKAIMVSANGFQSGCIEVAYRHGVKLLVLNEATDASVAHLVNAVTPGLNVYGVRFVATESGTEHELEDVGGRLAYLMNHARLIFPVGETTPNGLVHEWQLNNPSIFTDKENDVELPLPVGAELHVPYEGSMRVSSLRFKCSMVELLVPNQPVMDKHIWAGLAAKVELRDAAGNLEHAARLTDLQLGYDKPLETGKFYVLPSVHNHYYCDRIEGDLVHWVLVESYQHGHLIQAKLQQSLKYAGHYVEVTDERTLRRLKSMLTHLKRPREQR
jgi:hypothetical protein